MQLNCAELRKMFRKMKHNLKYKMYFILNTDGERSFWH